MGGEQKAQSLVSFFVCEKDRDVEEFIKTRAFQFEKLGKSRTFIVFDEDQPEFHVLGYFTLAIQVLQIPDTLSSNKLKHLDGFSAKCHGERITELPAILIGQFGKSDLHKDQFAGEELMQYCLSTLLDGQEHLGGRIVLLECKNHERLMNFYKRFGFVKIDRKYQENDLIQLVKVLGEDELILLPTSVD